MSIDMQQFNAVFFEEVSEHLANMESLLLDLDISAPSLDDLNAIFRAAHSIKGGAGIFGFDDMTEVTHILETLLDKLRKEELNLTSEMVDAFLQAGDILTAQRVVHQEGGEAVDAQKIKAVCKRLAKFSNEEKESTVALQANKTNHEQSTKNISFLTLVEEDVSHLLLELSKYGPLTSTSEQVEGFTKWQLVLSNCSASDDELTDSISFLAEQGSINIVETNNTQEDGFGFFEDQQTSETGGGAAQNTETQQDKGFALFDDKESTKKESEPSKNQDVETQPQQSLDNPKEKLPQTKNKKPAVSKRAENKSATTGETSIRVNTEKVDQLINQVGELVITQAMLQQISNDLDHSEHEVLLNRLIQLERNTQDLQESVMSIRMMPISFIFGRFPRVVRDLSSKLNKNIELRVIGDETELDKGLVEQLSDPLTHLIRNSIDHGIEMPEERIANGKSKVGIITLFAFYEGSNVVINITDDGAGLSRDKIIKKAQERGLGVNDNMSDHDVYQLVFSPGFSTAEKVTDVSGRGVGMDVVKRNIHKMGGQVDIQSQAGIGSTISIRLPLTLAILDGMSISVAGQIYIIPLTFILESLKPQADDIKSINGKVSMVKVRNEYIPLLALHELFNIDTDIKQACDGILVLLENNNKKIALLVDQLEGQQQVVLKSLETNFHAVPYVSGATIMGDGSVALILDVAGLVSESD